MADDVEKRLQRLEEKCENIPEMFDTVNRIEHQLVGDPFGGQRTFKSRLEALEEKHPELKEKLNDLKEEQSKMIQVSTGGAGAATILINALKELFI